MLSLIVGTLGREPELRRLLESLREQSYRDFEVLLVDQSGGESIAALLEDFTDLPIRRVVSERGLSRARNLALPLAKGKIVAFPDDDCWYPPHLLAQIEESFQLSPEQDGLSVRVTDEAGRCSAGGYMSPHQAQLQKSNIWRMLVSPSFFLRRAAIGDLRFDERLGAGSESPLGSGEETDFVLRLLETGAQVAYDGTLTVFHPRFLGPWHPSRGWLYGCGHGWVLRRHRYGLLRILMAATFQGIRAGQSLFCLRFRKATFHLVQAIGRLYGYFVLSRRFAP